MLTKQVVIDRIEVLEHGAIQVREATRIIDDGVQISQTYHRSCLMPGDDLSKQDAVVVTIAKAAWTSEVVAAHKASLAITEHQGASHATK